MTRNPQTKNKNVLKINPTSAETVVSAAAGIMNHNESPTVRRDIFFINLNIKLLKLILEFLYKKNYFKLLMIPKNRYAVFAYRNSLY
jgi:hypothetical protein|tara:strand:+ start:190 stop:450 length:261 start_codon:yes stop_codon:yes gene_type:complete